MFLSYNNAGGLKILVLNFFLYSRLSRKPENGGFRIPTHI